MTRAMAARLPPGLRAGAIVHPFPSSLNAGLVTVLVMVAGGGLPMALLLGGAMFGFQSSIGAVNDLVDQPIDARSKPAKPLPSGYLTRRTALAIAIAGGLIGIVLSAARGPVVLGLGLAMYACGLAYDLWLKPTPLASLCFAVAFPLLPVYAWWAATGAIPPRAELLLPVAALAGPTLQLANGLVDLQADAAAGIRGPAVRLGRRWALLALASMQVVIHGVAWITLLSVVPAPQTSVLAVAAASILTAVGVWLSARRDANARERGWQAQATAIVILGAAWLLAAVG